MSYQAKRYKKLDRRPKDDRRRSERDLGTFGRDERPERELSFNPARLFKPPEYEPRTDGQAGMLGAIDRNDIIYCLGPAGCGKTYLAVAKAVESLLVGETRKIVLARPSVEVGDTLGFQPGDLDAKICPYMRPLFDELENFLSPQQVAGMIRDKTIELQAIQFIRGRTLKHTTLIWDEAQNSTRKHFQALLGRLGEGSKYIITGDISKDEDGLLKQCDLPPGMSGLEEYSWKFNHLPGIARVELEPCDIVRHPLVRMMIEEGL